MSVIKHGNINLSFVKNKSVITKLSFLVDCKLYKGGKTQTQKSSRSELEEELRDAIPDELAGAAVEIDWFKEEPKQ